MDLIEELSSFIYSATQLTVEKEADDVGINILNPKNSWETSGGLSFGTYRHYYIPFDIPYNLYTYTGIVTAVLLLFYWILMILPGGDRTRSLTVPVTLPITIEVLLRIILLILGLFRIHVYGVIQIIYIIRVICQLLLPFSFVVNSFFLLLSQSSIAANRKMDMSCFPAFLIILANITLVALVVLLYIFLFQRSSLFYSIVVMVGHGVMIVGPILCVIVILAAPFACCCGSSAPDSSSSFAVFYAKIRLFWGSLFVFIASIPLMLSMLFSLLRVAECIQWSMILFDYKYLRWYSENSMRSKHYSSVGVVYQHASNFMPLLHELFPMWYLFWAIFLLTPFRRRLFCCESDKRKTKQISPPPTGYPITTVQQAAPPTHNHPTTNVQNTVHHAPAQHPSTVFPGPSTAPSQHPSTMFPERSTVPMQPTAPPMSVSPVPMHHNPHGLQVTPIYNTQTIPVSNMYPSLAQHTTPTSVAQPISLYPAIQPVMVFQAPPSPLLNQGYHIHNYPQNNQQQFLAAQMVSPGGIQPGSGYG